MRSGKKGHASVKRMAKVSKAKRFHGGFMAGRRGRGRKRG